MENVNINSPVHGTELYSPTIVKLPPPPAAAATSSQATPSGEASQERTNNTTSSTTTTTPVRPTPTKLPDPHLSSPRLSSPWDPDALSNHCSSCRSSFDHLFKRRHHCRLCGRLFCHECSNTRSLIPPSALVLKAESGNNNNNASGAMPSFADKSGNDDTSMTFVGTTNSLLNTAHDDTILYGRGLEQRMLLARHPQRTCHSCRDRLEPLQEELCLRNSNAMRYNYIDEGNHLRAHCNSPLAFTLGHEVRKAAYTLSNLLPGNEVRSTRNTVFMPTTNTDNEYSSYPPVDSDPCHVPSGASCKSIDPTLRKLDGLRIPAKVLQNARGVAVVTSAKAGIGFAGFEFGTGLVVARRSNPDGVVELDAWTAPSAISIASVAMGALVGAQVSDHVFLLMTDDAVRLFASDNGRSIQLGADVGVAVGPLGRSAEADLGATGSSRNLEGFGGGVAMSPIYSYSLSKGLYAGVSMDGRMLMTRDRVNEKFYGRSVSAHEILSGKVATPPAAQPLYDALKRCRVYGDTGSQSRNAAGLSTMMSHTTGAGMHASSQPSPRNGTNPYNLSGRDEYVGY
uniref:FYVE-type domain-containing protein n=1 Tax=Skeletonema marinoi TaxID=267567 RepID=A0A7S2KNH9_9STRA|mmetsp:Transcript_14919/g.25150  ORF Transcript_14919/g.25150 Transcript_14919/m.25150 type:complete len:568 (+) Transcript_14919:77-1780(+)